MGKFRVCCNLLFKRLLLLANISLFIIELTVGLLCKSVELHIFKSLQEGVGLGAEPYIVSHFHYDIAIE